jgi:hypothetical protein
MLIHILANILPPLTSREMRFLFLFIKSFADEHLNIFSLLFPLQISKCLSIYSRHKINIPSKGMPILQANFIWIINQLRNRVITARRLLKSMANLRIYIEKYTFFAKFACILSIYFLKIFYFN